MKPEEPAPSLSPRDRAVIAATLRIIADLGQRDSVPALDVLPLERDELELVKASVEGIFEGIEELAAHAEAATASVFDDRVLASLEAGHSEKAEFVKAACEDLRNFDPRDLP